MEILAKLGIDWKLLVAQIINFAILLAVLYKFVYKPLLALLEKREKMIAKSVDDAKAIEKSMRDTKKTVEETLANARTEASHILETAEQTSDARKKAAVEKTKEDLRQIVEQTRAMLKNEKQAMIQEAKEGIASLVVQATERILTDVAHEKVSDALAQKTLDKITA